MFGFPIFEIFTHLWVSVCCSLLVLIGQACTTRGILVATQMRFKKHKLLVSHVTMVLEILKSLMSIKSLVLPIIPRQAFFSAIWGGIKVYDVSLSHGVHL